MTTTAPTPRSTRIDLHRVPESVVSASVLGLAVALWFARFPLANWLTAAASLGVLLWYRGRRPGSVPRALVALWALLAAGSGLGYLFSGGSLAGSYLLDLLPPVLLGSAIFCSGRLRTNLTGLLGGMAAGLAVSLLIAVVEISTGFKLSVFTLPDGDLRTRIAHDPILTTALFANFNDLSLGLAILVIIATALLLFSRLAAGAMLLTAGTALTATVLIVLMGSRGALLALAAGLGLELVLARRARHPGFVTPMRLAGGLVVLGAGAGLIWGTSFIQDTSTASRERIFSAVVSTMESFPVYAAVGFGTSQKYNGVMDVVVNADDLLDPHNVMLELVVRYGALGFLAVVGFWAVLCGWFLLHRPPTRDWRAVSLVTLLAVTPLMGIVPSSYLAYPYLNLAVIGCLACVRLALNDEQSAESAAIPRATGRQPSPRAPARGTKRA
ncbi:MAG: hypothetical protein KBB39_01425 [Phycicoccus sp.]|nr:hypothetical protein [Phycicoccus sp.]